MASPLQQYNAMLMSNGRSPSNFDGGAESALGMAVAGSAVGLQATLPIVENNLSYADAFNNIANTTSRVGDAVGVYGGYKSALGLIDPWQGEGAFQETLSPGNAVNTGGQLAWYNNPVTGTLQALNQLTANEENPFGQVPGVSNINEFVANQSARLNATGVAQSIRSGLGTAYGNTIGPIMSSTPGQLAYNTAMLPVSAIESGYNFLKESGEWVDRTLFGNYLPGLANEEKPLTMEWNNPAQPLIDNVNAYSGILERNQYASEPVGDVSEIPVDETNDDWIRGELNNLMDTINLNTERVTDNLGDINVSKPNVSYPNLELNTEFEVPISEGNEQYANALEQNARGDRFVDDPNDISETGEGFTYVPVGYTFDPEVGLIKMPGSSLGQDNADYTYLSDQDRQVMNSVLEKANQLESKKMFLDPTREYQVLNSATLNEANRLEGDHNHMMKGAMYDAMYRYDFRKKNPETKLGDYFLYNGASTNASTGRTWNPSNINEYWSRDIDRQVSNAIQTNYTHNYNYVSSPSTSAYA